MGVVMLLDNTLCVLKFFLICMVCATLISCDDVEEADRKEALSNEINASPAGDAESFFNEGGRIAYAINNMALKIDHCVIDKNGCITCYVYLGVSMDDPREPGWSRGKWARISFDVGISEVNELDRLISEADIQSLDSEYHDEMVDGTIQYLGVLNNEDWRIYLFNNMVPEQAQPLIEKLDSLMQRAYLAGDRDVITSPSFGPFGQYFSTSSF